MSSRPLGGIPYFRGLNYVLFNVEDHSRLSGARHIPAERLCFLLPLYVLQIRSVTRQYSTVCHEVTLGKILCASEQLAVGVIVSPSNYKAF
jgi:hypothetical protein